MAEEKNTNLDVFGYNLIDNEFSVPEINTLAAVEIKRGENNSNHFVNEDNAFEKWLNVSKQTNSVVMDEQFFKLLSSFTKDLSDVLSNDGMSSKCNIDSKPNCSKKTDFNYLFKSPLTDENVMMKKETNNVNELSPRNQKKISSSIVSVNRIECDKIDITLQISDNESAEETIFDNLFKNQKHISSEKCNFNQSFCLSDGRKSPIVCSGQYKTKNSIKYDQNGRARKFNFNELFKSQGSEQYNKNHSEIVDNPYDQQFTSYDCYEDRQRSRKNINIIKLNKNFDKSLSGTVKKNVSDKDQDEKAMANINIEDLFMSQKANAAYIEKYNDNIIVNEQSTSDSNDSIIMIHNTHNNQKIRRDWYKAGTSSCKSNSIKHVKKVMDLNIEKYNDNVIVGQSSLHSSISSRQKSPEVGHNKDKPKIFNIKSDGKRKKTVKLDDLSEVQHVNTYTENYMERATTDFHLPKDGIPNTIINLIDDEKEDPIRVTERNVIHREDNIDAIDVEDIFNSQRVNRYIKNNMVKILVSPVKIVVSDNAVDEDDIISVNNSPEFFTCRLPKKIVQTKLSDCIHNTTTVVPTTNDEVIDLLTPDFADDHLVQNDGSTYDQSKSNDDVNDFNDDDDMDFMFIDYTRGLDSGTNTVSQKNKIDCSSKNAFTQKILVHNRIPNVFTQKSQFSNNRIDERLEQDSDNSTDSFMQNHWVSDDSSPNFFTQKLRVVENKTKTARTTPTVTPPPQDLLNHKHLTATNNNVFVDTPRIPPFQNDDVAKVAAPAQPYNSGLVPFNIMKACNLLKPGFSLKRNPLSTKIKPQVDNKLLSTTMAFKNQQSVVSIQPSALPVNILPSVLPVTIQHVDTSPIATTARQQLKFAQSTPKVPINTLLRRCETVTAPKTTVLMTSSSDSDVFIDNCDNNSPASFRRIRKKRQPKLKKVSFSLLCFFSPTLYIFFSIHVLVYLVFYQMAHLIKILKKKHSSYYNHRPTTFVSRLVI